MAKYNLLAGKAAIKLSDFSSACSFFSCGIDFLPDNKWSDHYDLSIELFELMSKSTLATGNVESMHVYTGEVLKNARCFQDKLNVYHIIITAYSCASKMTDALAKGSEILLCLGEEIPMSPSQEAINTNIQQTQAMIRGMTEETLLHYRPMTDTNKLWAMKFLATLQSISFMLNPTLHSYLTLRMVQLTISYGKPQ
jgi:predicted ATPase